MPKAASSSRNVKEGRRRTKKDPDAPKRALSAYMCFVNDNRSKIREENPHASFGEVGKLLGRSWKGLDEKERQPYELKAARDKKRYEEEKRIYNESRSQ